MGAAVTDINSSLSLDPDTPCVKFSCTFATPCPKTE
jgi:hypothetical protein